MIVLRLRILSLFYKRKKTSLQKRVNAYVSANKEVESSLIQEYQKLLNLVDKIKYKKANFTKEEWRFLAENFRSVKNELDGKSLRFHISQANFTAPK